ncbi:hypothetical protein Pfo_007220 [Paulownia fortunei]|nr:hypothetical protein Pfo_007220 [Paulownia fortunei]
MRKIQTKGVQKLQFVNILKSRREIGGFFTKRMAWSLEKFDGHSVEAAKMGLVRPAMEDYAEEAIEAVRAGKVIACLIFTTHDPFYSFIQFHYFVPFVDSLLPGPVTLVLRRGVRVPDCNFIRVIARGSGSALALTSANLSGQPSSVDVRDFENLWQHCAYVYNDGVLPSGRAGSTVVELTTLGKYKILRPGSAKEETVAILERHALVEDGNAS